MKAIVIAVVLALLLATVPGAWAQDKAADIARLQALQTAARKDKKALVADTLKLTEPEAKKFWPVYESYQRDLDAVTRRRSVALEGLVARDRPMSDPYAKNIGNDLMATEEQEVKALRKMTNAVMKALPPKKAVRYMQLENKLRAIQDYDIAVAFPLAQ